MEELVDGTQRGVVVECKHTGTVGRPVVQKLHSAVATFEFDGPKRGMVATTGRFTGPAVEYAERLRRNDDPYPIELIDGEDLREIADDIGLDLYNGRIEILCDETLRPFDPAMSMPTTPVSSRDRSPIGMRRTRSIDGSWQGGRQPGPLQRLIQVRRRRRRPQSLSSASLRTGRC
jgi:restriction endonuclease Mrr